jgi:hypothetical protein
MITQPVATVPYRVVIAHYAQLLRTLGLQPWSVSVARAAAPSSGAPLPTLDVADVTEVLAINVWPDHELSLSAAGGVSLYGVYAALDAAARASCVRVCVPDAVPPHTPSSGGSGSGSGSARQSPAGASTALRDGDFVPRRLVVSEVPPCLALVNPRMTVSEYAQLKSEESFLEQGMAVCDECFLVYAKVRRMLPLPRVFPRLSRALLAPRVLSLVLACSVSWPVCTSCLDVAVSDVLDAADTGELASHHRDFR